MTDIFREVEEDLRRERLKSGWQRYGGYVIAVAVLIVVGTAGWRGYEFWAERRTAELADEYTAAIDLSEAGQNEEALSALATLGDGGSGYATLARFRAASQTAASGDVEGAVAAYDALAADGGIGALLNDMARVQAAYLLVDTASVDEIGERVGGLDAPDGAWRHAARDVMGLSAYRAEDYTAAAQMFQEAAADPEAPAGLRQRADLMLELLAGIQPPDEAASAAPAEPVAPAETGTLPPPVEPAPSQETTQ